jgi:hypothetical protein
MATRIDKCLFEILVAFTQAELLALCQFIHSKIDRYHDELFKIAAYVNTAAEQGRQVKAVLQLADGLFNSQIAFSPLGNIAKDIAPSCAELEIVFQGVTEAGSFTQASRDTLRQVGKQLDNIQKILETSSDAAEEVIAFLTNLCGIIQRAAGAGFTSIEKELKNQGVLSGDNIVNQGIPNNPIPIKFP